MEGSFQEWASGVCVKQGDKCFNGFIWSPAMMEAFCKQDLCAVPDEGLDRLGWGDNAFEQGDCIFPASECS